MSNSNAPRIASSARTRTQIKSVDPSGKIRGCLVEPLRTPSKRIKKVFAKVDSGKPTAERPPTTASKASDAPPPDPPKIREKRKRRSKKRSKKTASVPPNVLVAPLEPLCTMGWHKRLVDNTLRELQIHVAPPILEWYVDEVRPLYEYCWKVVKVMTRINLSRLSVFSDAWESKDDPTWVTSDELETGMAEYPEFVECSHEECKRFWVTERSTNTHRRWVNRPGRSIDRFINDAIRVEMINHEHSKSGKGSSRARELGHMWSKLEDAIANLTHESAGWLDNDKSTTPPTSERGEAMQAPKDDEILKAEVKVPTPTRHSASPVAKKQKKQAESAPIDAKETDKSTKGKPPKKDRSRFPAVRNHNHKNHEMFPEITYHIPVSRSWTEAKVKLLGAYHPTTLAAVHRYDRDNEHPLCAAVRAIAEADALKCAINDMAALNQSGKVLDVGGAVKRHFTNKREYVWSCNPDNTPKDLLRKFAIPGKNHCNCRWQECNCTDNVISISVHSLYYLTPAEITDRLLRQKIPTHYAVLHVYKDDMGQLMDGEMSYVKRNGMVRVTALGNWQSYVHSDMQWLSEGSWSDGKRTLTWEIDRRFMDVYVFKFVAYAGVVQDALTLDPAGILVDDEAAEEVQFAKVVNECLAPHKSMNTQNRSSYLERVVRKGRALDLNILRLTTYADKAYMEQPVTLVTTPFYTPWVAAMRDARMSMQANWQKWLNAIILALVPLLLVLIGSHLVFGVVKKADVTAIVALLKWCLQQLPEFWFVTGIQVIVVALLWAVFSRSRARARGLPFSILEMVWRYFRELFLTLSVCHITRAKVVDYCCDYPDKPTDPRKLRGLRLPRDYAEECVRKDAAYAMVYHPHYAPHFPAGCSHNVVSSLKNKLCQLIPSAGKYNLPLHPELIRAAALIRANLEPMSWDEWCGRFPSEKRAKFEREKSNNSDSRIHNWNATGFFTKFEAYPEPKYPRPIGSACVELNYSLGRWLIGIAESLAGVLPENLMFPIHGDADAMGHFYAQYHEYCKMDCDFSSFDSSQTEEALELVSEFVSRCGVPDHVVDRMRLDQQAIKVTTRKGLKANCRGFRVSGRSETLLGNTLITINTSLHLFGDALVAGLFKGDDTVVFLRHGTYDVASLTKRYLDQGLVAKLRRVDDYQVEFCSSLFLPTNRGFVLAPKPGKILAKTLWCRNLDYGPIEIKDQFASILKGMANAGQCIPGFKGLYENAEYLARFNTVTAKHDEYGERSHLKHEVTNATIDYMCNRYQLDASDFEALQSELSSSFPIRLQSEAARVMIELDWGPSNEGEHLREYCEWSWPEQVDYMNILVSPSIEEFVRWLWPVTASLVLGLVESICQNDWTHLVGHAFLGYVSYWMGPFMALILHTYHNAYTAGSINLSIFRVMKKRGKRASKKTGNPANKVKPSKGKRRNSKRSNGMKSLSPYAALVADPCGAELVPGLYGSDSGLLARFKSMFAPIEPTTSGYVLWDPLGAAKGRYAMSFFYYVNEDWNAHPTNTSVSPFGLEAANTSGLSLEDQGANGFIQTQTVEDYRTLSACIRMSYVGDTSQCAGRVAYVENLPVRALPGHDAQPALSVRGLFQLATKVERVPLDTVEVTWRPDEVSGQVFRNTDLGTLSSIPGGVTTVSKAAEESTRTFFGFAFDGIPASKLRFDVVQNVEWRAAPYEGYVSLVPKQVSPPLVSRVVSYLDNKYPGWQTTLARHGANVAAKVANMALGGAGLRTALSVLQGRQLNVIGYH